MLSLTKKLKSLVSLACLALCILTAIGIGMRYIDRPSAGAHASARAQYGQILQGAYLYRQSGDNFVRVTSIPFDYFVLIIDRTNPDFFAVTYHDLTGFVRPSSIMPVDFEPYSKSAVGTLAPLPGLGVHLRPAPDHTQPEILTLPSNAQLDFYGTIDGSFIHQGTIWFFVRHGNLRGYVYGGHIVMIAPIPPNEVRAADNGGNGSTNTTNRYPFELDNVRQGIIIACLALAVLFVMLALYRPFMTATHRSPRHRN